MSYLYPYPFAHVGQAAKIIHRQVPGTNAGPRTPQEWFDALQRATSAGTTPIVARALILSFNRAVLSDPMLRQQIDSLDDDNPASVTTPVTLWTGYARPNQRNTLSSYGTFTGILEPLAFAIRAREQMNPDLISGFGLAGASIPLLISIGGEYPGTRDNGLPPPAPPRPVTPIVAGHYPYRG